MKSPLDKYLKEIKKLYPSYIGPRRGRGQARFLSFLDTDEKEKFMFLERKIILEKNRISAKCARERKKSALENLTRDNKELKSLIDNLYEINSKLRNQIKTMREPKIITIFKEKEKEIEKEENFSDLDFLVNEIEEPIIFDTYLD